MTNASIINLSTEATRRSNIASYQLANSISAVLRPFYNPLLTEDQQIQYLDMSPAIFSAGAGLSNADLIGINLFTSLKTLILGTTTNPSLAWAANLSNLASLTKLVLYHSASFGITKSQVILELSAAKLPALRYLDMGITYGMYGDMSGFTTLTFIVWDARNDTGVSAPAGPVILPVLGNNKSMTFIQISAVDASQPWTITNIGDVSNLMSLTRFNISGTASAATINYILAKLLVLRNTAGNVLNSIVLSSTAGMAAPTGQGVTDKAALVALMGSGNVLTN